jgi:hypothetical protein
MLRTTGKVGVSILLIAFCAATWIVGNRAYAQDAAVGSNTEISTLKGIDLPGTDYRRLKRVTLERCRSTCLEEERCRSFTYNIGARMCFLKSEVPEQKPFGGATSGVKQQSAADDESNEDLLIVSWQQANEHCGEIGEGKAEAAAWCEVRSALGVVLGLRDWCYAKKGEAAEKHRWHECEITSIRAEIPKSVSSPDKYRRSDAPIAVTSPEIPVTPPQQNQSPVPAEQPEKTSRESTAPVPDAAEQPAQSTQ